MTDQKFQMFKQICKVSVAFLGFKGIEISLLSVEW